MTTVTTTTTATAVTATPHPRGLKPFAPPTPTVTVADDTRREVRELHEFFAAWFRGDREQERFDRVAGALAPTFRLVRPDGTETDREAVLEGVRAARGTEAPSFRIDVRDLRVRRRLDDHCLVTYEEWQHRDGAWDGRRSTALLARESSAPAGVVWLDLQETRTDGDEPPDDDGGV